MAHALFAVLSAAAPRVGALEQMPARTEDELRSRIEAILSARGVPGAGVALATRAGGGRAFGLGIADPATGRRVDADTQFRWASLSKAVTALAVMTLVEDGRISLDDEVRRVAPEVPFENPWEGTHPVRVAHLLEHTAGWEFGRPNEEFDDRFPPRPLMGVLRLNPRSRRCRWPPGTLASYSNEGYLVAGYLLEKAAGRPFDEVVRERVLLPLGMDGAAFRRDLAPAGRLAEGIRRGRPVPYQEDMMRPAAGILGSARDMSRWLAFWIGRGSEGHGPVSAAGIARVESRRTLLHPGPDLEYGLGNAASERQGVLLRGHVGYTLGFISSFQYAPQEGFGWGVLLSSEDSPGAREAIEDEIFRYLATVIHPVASRRGTVSDGELARYVGWYREAAPGSVLLSPLDALGGFDVELRGGRLERRSLAVRSPRDLFTAGAWQPMEPLSGGRFALPGESMASLRFAKHGGKDLMVEQLGAYERSSRLVAGAARLLAVAALLLLVSAMALAPVLLVTAARGACPLARGAPLGALSAVTLVALWLVVSRSPEPLGTINYKTVAVLVLPTTFAALSGAALWASVLDLARPIALYVKIYQILASISACGLTVFGWRAGWIGLATWRW